MKQFCDFLLNKSINTLFIVDTNIDTLVVNDTDLKNFSDWEGWGVGSKDGLLRGQGVKLLEQLLLQAEVFNDGFNDEIWKIYIK